VDIAHTPRQRLAETNQVVHQLEQWHSRAVSGAIPN
jgi:hypothetical protein